MERVYDLRDMRCPTCGKTIERHETDFPPFCSERCKLTDLGRWLGGEYAVPGEPASAEEIAAELAASEERKPRS